MEHGNTVNWIMALDEANEQSEYGCWLKQAEELMRRYENLKRDYRDIQHGKKIMWFAINKKLPFLFGNPHNVSKSSDKILWITINPKPEVDFLIFKKKIESYVRLKFMQDVYYSFEQRGETDGEMGKGFHCHILSTKPTKTSPQKVWDKTYAFFKDYVGTQKNLLKEFICVQDFPRDPYREDKMAYLKGNKWDEDKYEKILIDEKWRKKNALLTLYHI